MSVEQRKLKNLRRSPPLSKMIMKTLARLFRIPYRVSALVLLTEGCFWRRMAIGTYPTLPDWVQGKNQKILLSLAKKQVTGVSLSLSVSLSLHSIIYFSCCARHCQSLPEDSLFLDQTIYTCSSFPLNQPYQNNTIQLLPKTIGNRKKILCEVALGGPTYEPSDETNFWQGRVKFIATMVTSQPSLCLCLS